MKIEPKEVLDSKPVGSESGDTVYMNKLVGGLHLVMVMRKGKAHLLGMGSHPAVALHIAEQQCAKQNRSLVLSRLEKSESLERAFMVPQVVDRFSRLTEEISQDMEDETDGQE